MQEPLPAAQGLSSFCHNVTASLLGSGRQEVFIENSVHCICLQTSMSHAHQSESWARISARKASRVGSVSMWVGWGKGALEGSYFTVPGNGSIAPARGPSLRL